MSRTRQFITLLASTPDTTAPTCTITCAQTSPSATSPLNFTFTFSESVTGFVIGDITAGNGTKSNFAGSGAVYTCDVTPTASGTVTVDVAAGVCTDVAGNGNTAATQFSITAIVFILRDEFTTTETAPMVSPRTCEPGPGTLTITDAANKLHVTGGKLIGDTVATLGKIVSASITRAAGKAVISNATIPTAQYLRLGWDVSIDNIVVKNDEFYVFDNGLLFSIAGAVTTHDLTVVQKSAGQIYIIDNSIVYVSNIDTSNRTAIAQIDATAAGAQIANFRVCQLPAPWATDTGIATNVVASPSVGEITTQEADALAEMTWTAVTGQTWNLYVRRGADDTHTYCVRCDQGGSTVKLIEINGSETEKASAAQTFTNGVNYRVVVVMYGNTIRVVINNASKILYTSATYNNTATGVKTDRAGTNLITWPRTLNGSALSVMTAARNP